MQKIYTRVGQNNNSLLFLGFVRDGNEIRQIFFNPELSARVIWDHFYPIEEVTSLTNGKLATVDICNNPANERIASTLGNLELNYFASISECLLLRKTSSNNFSIPQQRSRYRAILLEMYVMSLWAKEVASSSTELRKPGIFSQTFQAKTVILHGQTQLGVAPSELQIYPPVIVQSTRVHFN